MDYKNMFDRIIRNNGGTFDLDGNAVEFNSGYMVSLPDVEYQVPLKYVNYAHIEAHINVVQDEQGKSDSELFFGAWIEDDIVYLDASRHIVDRDAAERFGKLWDQLAIWDCKNQAPINLK